jgi:hypothetical protein
MKLGKKPRHCKGCLSFHSAGHPKNSPYVIYNAWCCSMGAPAYKAVGWCKLNNKKTERVDYENAY